MNRRALSLGIISVSLFSLVPRVASAQERAWIDVNAARFQARQKEQAFSFGFILSQEAAAVAAAYPSLSDNADIDVSGGVQIGHGLGVGIHFDGQTYKSTVGLAISIPSPFFFNTPGTDAKPTASELERRKRAIDIGATYTVPTASDKLSVRVFGGPTFFHLENEMVEIVRYNQVASALLRINIVSITTFTTKQVSESSVGFHVGGDVGYFFSRHVGVGGGVRMNRSKVTITEPLTAEDEDLVLGHVAFGGGLRLRF